MYRVPGRLCLLATLLFALCGAATPTLAAVVSGHGGVDIHYRQHGDGDITLIFVHGWTCDGSYWDAQIDAFAGDYRVLVLDLGGHGDSGDERDDWSMKAFGADVAAVADAAATNRIVLVGHSMGGPVVIEAALAIGERVEKVVAVDTLQEPAASGYSEEESLALWAPFTADFAGSVEGFVRNSFFLPSAPSDIVDHVAKDMASAEPAVALAAGHALTTWSPSRGIAAIRDVPFVLMNADYRPTDGDALEALHPSARVVSLSGVGHFPMLVDPETFNAELAAVITQ